MLYSTGIIWSTPVGVRNSTNPFVYNAFRFEVVMALMVSEIGVISTYYKYYYYRLSYHHYYCCSDNHYPLPTIISSKQIVWYDKRIH